MQLEVDINTILYSLCAAPKLKLKPKVQKPKMFVHGFRINCSESLERNLTECLCTISNQILYTFSFYCCIQLHE